MNIPVEPLRVYGRAGRGIFTDHTNAIGNSVRRVSPEITTVLVVVNYV